MIEGTKPYRGRASTAKNSVEATSESTPFVEAPRPNATIAGDTVTPQRPAPPTERNVGRREWFRSLVPAFGSGLVEILRTSNNLQTDLQELGASRGPRKP